MGKGLIHTALGDTGKFDETGVPRGETPSGADMDKYGATIKNGRGIQGDRFSGSYL